MLDPEGFIDVRGWKALGKPLPFAKVKEVKLLAPKIVDEVVLLGAAQKNVSEGRIEGDRPRPNGHTNGNPIEAIAEVVEPISVEPDGQLGLF